MQKSNIKFLTRVAAFTAIIILLTFTPIGYIPLTPVLTITIIQIPVIIGAVLLGPVAGIILGIVWGVTALIRIPIDPLGAILFAQNPFFTAIVCIIPRILVGFLTGIIVPLLLKLVDRFTKSKSEAIGAKVAVYGFMGFIGSALNTILFLSTLALMFHSVVLEESSFRTFWVFISSVVVTNGVPEFVISMIVVAPICKILDSYSNLK